MQKKLIALAIAGFVAAPVAMAQSNVTIYGQVDMGYQYSTDGVKLNSAGETESISSKNAIDSGNWAPSRIGFRGSEDLGNGLSALFQLEYGQAADRFGGDFTSRDSYIGLRGNFGTVLAGRLTTPQNAFVGRIDPFGLGGLGDVTKGIYTQTTVLGGGTRLDNTIAYVTPTWSGFTVTAAYSNNAFNDEAVENANDIRVWAISPVYANGPLVVGGNYHQAKRHNTTDRGRGRIGLTNDTWDLGATYDFGVVKVHALYGVDELDGANDASGITIENEKWMLGLSAPVGEAGRVMFSYGESDPEFRDASGRTSESVEKWAIGYTHKLSNRTLLYTAYSDISASSGLAALNSAVNDTAQAAGLQSGGVGGSFAGGYREGFQVGIRHSF